jgi:hypothetical protein
MSPGHRRGSFFTPHLRRTLTVITFLIWLASAWKRATRRRSFSSPSSTPRLIVVVEGRHDIEFLRRISSILYAPQPSLPDLTTVERRDELLFVPADRVKSG